MPCCSVTPFVPVLNAPRCPRRCSVHHSAHAPCAVVKSCLVRAHAEASERDSSEPAPKPKRTPPVVKDKWWTKLPQDNLLEATSVSDLVTILEENKDRLVLVDFFAPWCNACKALYPKLSQLCAQNPQVVVVKLNWEENKSMAKTLGVKVLPFFHAYHGSMGRVAAFSSSISKIQRLRDCMNLFGYSYCDIGNVNVKQSLPEIDFDGLPNPSDATKLVYASDDESDHEARALM